MDAQRNSSPTAKVKQIIFLIAYSLLAGCATVDLPNIGSQGFKVEDDEKRLYNRARETVEYLDHSGVIYPDSELEAYLTNVARNLVPAELPSADIQYLDIQVKVINDPDINAFALPNGRIYFHTGMLALMENEAELAAIMGHEMVHVLNRHVLKQKRSTENKTTFLNITLGGIFPMGYQLGALSSIAGFSKQLELEADTQGFSLLVKSSYDAGASIRIFEKIKTALEEEKQSHMPFFFSTHPAVVTRLNNYKKLIDTQPSAAIGKINEADFQRVTKKMFFDTLRLWMQYGRFKTVEQYVSEYLQRNPKSIEGYYLKGELYRQRQDCPKGVKKRDKTNDYPEALLAYDQVIENDPSFSRAYQSKGKTLRSMQKDAEAKEAFRKYLELDPQSPDRAYIEAYLNNQ